MQSKLDWKKLEGDEGRAWQALTRALLRLRQQHIVPLLATAGGHSGRVVNTAEGFLAVTWTQLLFALHQEKQSEDPNRDLSDSIS